MESICDFFRVSIEIALNAGIKKENIKIVPKDFYKAVEEMTVQGVEVFILGCTELSSVYKTLKMDGTYIDPLKVITIRAIDFAGKKRV